MAPKFSHFVGEIKIDASLFAVCIQVYMTDDIIIDQERMELGDDGFTGRTFRRLREFIRRMNSSQDRWYCFGVISKKLRLKRGSAAIDTYLWTFDQKYGTDSWWEGLTAFGTECPYFTNVVHSMLMENNFIHEFDAPLTHPVHKSSFRGILFCFVLSSLIVAAFLLYQSLGPQFKGDDGDDGNNHRSLRVN